MTITCPCGRTFAGIDTDRHCPACEESYEDARRDRAERERVSEEGDE